MRLRTLIEVGQDFRKLPDLRFRMTVLPFISDLHGLSPQLDADDSFAPQRPPPNFLLKVIQESFAFEVRRGLGNQQFAAELGFLRPSPVRKIEQYRIQFIRINSNAAPTGIKVIGRGFASHKASANIDRLTAGGGEIINRGLESDQQIPPSGRGAK